MAEAQVLVPAAPAPASTPTGAEERVLREAAAALGIACSWSGPFAKLFEAVRERVNDLHARRVRAAWEDSDLRSAEAWIEVAERWTARAGTAAS
jgi:hypothetical protein